MLGWKPVKRELVLEPQPWGWSSFPWYSGGLTGPVRLNDDAILKMRISKPAASVAPAPAPCKKRKERGTPFRFVTYNREGRWATRQPERNGELPLRWG